MIDRDFTAYVECLPPQDRITVEQALKGLREVLVRSPRMEPEAQRTDALLLIDVVTAQMAHKA